MRKSKLVHAAILAFGLLPAFGFGHAGGAEPRCGCAGEEQLEGWKKTYVAARFRACELVAAPPDVDRMVGYFSFGAILRVAPSDFATYLKVAVAQLTNALSYNLAVTLDLKGHQAPQILVVEPHNMLRLRSVTGESRNLFYYLPDPGSIKPHRVRLNFFVGETNSDLSSMYWLFMPLDTYETDIFDLGSACQLKRYRYGTRISGTTVRLGTDDPAIRMRCMLTGALTHYGFSGAPFLFESALTNLDPKSAPPPALLESWAGLTGPEGHAYEPRPGQPRCSVVKDLLAR